MAKLGDIATYVNGFAFKPTDWSDTGLPIIRIQDLTGNSYQANRYNGKYDSKYEILDGDVLISWSASLGVYVWHGETALLNQHIFKVVFNKVDVDKNFFIHQVKAILEKASSEAHGATMKHLTKPVFDALPFYLPSIEEQKDIAEKLDKVCTLIEQRKQQIEKLDQLVKSRFIELFGDIHIPSKWEKKPWSELVTIQNGRDYKNILVESGGYPVYGTGGEMARASDYLCPENTIIVGRKGTINNPLLVKEKFWNVDTAFGVIAGNQLHYQYFYNFCRMFDFSTLNKQAVLPSTTKADLLKIEIAVPPMELQNQFATFVEQTDKSKLAVQQSLEKLEILKNSLMQDYFG